MTRAADRGNRLKKSIVPYLYILPSLLVVISVLILPILYGLYLSFFNPIIGIEGMKFVGLLNYKKFVTAPEFLNALKHSFQWAGGAILGGSIMSLAAAMLMNERYRGRNFLRAVILIPWVISEVAVALVWGWILNGSYGLINNILFKLGMVKNIDDILWLSNPKLVLWICTAIAVWRGFPFGAIVWLATLESIPNQIYEAAQIDGANAFNRFLYVTWPELKPSFVLVNIVGGAAVFNSFGLIWVLTRGGPLRYSEILATHLYKVAFWDFRIGAAAAISVVMFLITAICAVVFLYITQIKEA